MIFRSEAAGQITHVDTPGWTESWGTDLPLVKVVGCELGSDVSRYVLTGSTRLGVINKRVQARKSGWGCSRWLRVDRTAKGWFALTWNVMRRIRFDGVEADE